jgi:hypothetical protein
MPELHPRKTTASRFQGFLEEVILRLTAEQGVEVS